MNTNDTLETLIEDQERRVTELREQLKFEAERLKHYRIAQVVLSELNVNAYDFPFTETVNVFPRVYVK